VFIELTDHLRCPVEHDEAYLVLIPEQMSARSVVRGLLGCPVCQREYGIVDGVAWLGTDRRTDGQTEGAATAPPSVRPSVPPSAIHAFLGLEGPGGYVALVGEATRYATGLAEELPGVHLALIDPPTIPEASARWSVLQSPRLPIKTSALRGTVLGADVGSDPFWQGEALRVVLPGLRVVGQGAAPELVGLELMGMAEGWWVGRRAS
jgi:uncharacterized protein YbaR (Trm112 family)